ncbi:MAG: lamin tail domain-containing protein [Candidatus Acetothermia bacterium]|jgi:endonuclease YncB( thermonuclease family)|nr:lamin tail domain-containing protein [Candidatus Acetothermia bacterium]MDH7505787.1 lamin tail domain-containing protein [Candidatus Acetothermia bacterium]
MPGKILLALPLAVVSCLVLIAEPVELQQVRGVSARDGDTIVAELHDGGRGEVRYASINAPGLGQCLGPEAKQCNEALTKDLWLELDPTDGGYQEVRDRLLAHVFLRLERSQTSSIEVQLVAEGCARLDVIDPNDTQLSQEKDFDVRYADWLVAAQLEAARSRNGWWGQCDDYGDSEVMIAAIKQWSDDEVVYILNRGDEEVDLEAGWKLSDGSGSPRNTLDFGQELAGQCILPAGGLLRVHSGPVSTGRGGEHTACGEQIIDFHWTGHKIWDNGKDEAWLYRPDGTVAYRYSYPLDWD